MWNADGRRSDGDLLIFRSGGAHPHMPREPVVATSDPVHARLKHDFGVDDDAFSHLKIADQITCFELWCPLATRLQQIALAIKTTAGCGICEASVATIPTTTTSSAAGKLSFDIGVMIERCLIVHVNWQGRSGVDA